MKIAAPVSKVEEIAPLAEAGADEFYCSVLPPGWLEQFNSSAISRRPFGNLPDFSQLELAVESAHALDRRLSLVINAQQYTEAQARELINLTCLFDELSGDSIIVSDAALLASVHATKHDFDLHLSSIAGCRNVESARFFSELGVKRIIFPRDMTTREMTSIAHEAPELDFEAFMLNDGCSFEEGACHTIHLPGELGGPICVDNYETQYQRIDGLPLEAEMEEQFRELEALHRHWLWYRFSCGFSVTAEGYPYGPCGLCAIPTLAEAGVRAIKIAGRDYPTDRKVKSVEMVKHVLDHYASTTSTQATMEYAVDLRGEPNHCDAKYMCYYPG